MLLNFVKMHGAGNDFVLIDLITQNLRLHNAHLQACASRHFGVGCDQVLLIEPPLRPESAFSYRIFNVDGSEAKQCLNGARCAARYCIESGLWYDKRITAESIAGPVECLLKTKGMVELILDAPTLGDNFTIALHNTVLPVQIVDMGNLHAIVTLPKHPEEYPLAEIARLIITQHPALPGLNVSLAMTNGQAIFARTYENGVGPTLACGSAAVAITKAAGIKRSEIIFPRGNIQVELYDNKVSTTGPTATVFTGQLRV